MHDSLQEKKNMFSNEKCRIFEYQYWKMLSMSKLPEQCAKPSNHSMSCTYIMPLKVDFYAHKYTHTHPELISVLYFAGSNIKRVQITCGMRKLMLIRYGRSNYKLISFPSLVILFDFLSFNKAK